MTAKPAKCQLGMQQCVYLGHLVGNREVRPEQGNIDTVANFPRPATKKKVHSFLGLTGYYRKLIPNYSTTALPLTDLKKDATTRVKWTDACETAFNELKRRLTSSTVLKSPDLSLPFIVQTDACSKPDFPRRQRISSTLPQSYATYYIERNGTPQSKKNVRLSNLQFKPFWYTSLGEPLLYKRTIDHWSGFTS